MGAHSRNRTRRVRPHHNRARQAFEDAVIGTIGGLIVALALYFATIAYWM